MNNAYKFILFIIISITSSSSLADGNILLKSCQSAIDLETEENKSKQASALYCMGLIRGATYMHYMFTETKSTGLYCLPDKKLKINQMLRVVVKYLNQHPEKLHKNETLLIAFSFIDSFPCKE